ncbi:hypothetical protein RUM44_010471 [Polyplax serrata]|uniref:Uncharacterized protein n=1 Tax=Polyplax serrata TaxID=468196 RepID=A0ABR1AVK4_POLSC
MPITPGNLKTAEIMLSGRATAHRMEHIDAPFSPLPPPGGGFIPSGEKVKDLTQKSGLSPDHDIVTERKRKLFGVRTEEEEEEEEINTLVRSAPSVSADVQLEGGLTEEFPTEFLFL